MTDVPMKTSATNDRDLALRADIEAMIKRHLTPDTADRVLAIAAQIVGHALALQDQRTMTKEHAMAIVIANIEDGNRAVIDRLHNTKGNA